MNQEPNSLLRRISRPEVRRQAYDRLRDKTRHRKLIGMKPNLWKMTEGMGQYLTLQSQLWRMLETKERIVIGPWLSEVGFEVLYWIPFVRWFKDYYQVPSEKLTILSRGGCKDWYQGISDDYVELLDLFTPEEFQAWTLRRWEENAQGQKQYAWSPFEAEVKSRLQKSVPRFANLNDQQLGFAHPGFMYNLFKYYWRGRLPAGSVASRTKIESYACREDFGLDLPPQFTAAKFYFSGCFPKTDANQEFTYRLLQRLSQNGPVVLLSAGTRLDEHRDVEIPANANLLDFRSQSTPQNNLAFQTSILAKAKRWVGTYGGFSYLGPFYGVSSLALFSERDQFLSCHLDWMAHVTRALRKQRPGGDFSAVCTASIS